MSNKYFTITTSKGAVQQIEKVLHSPLFAHRKSFRISTVSHNTGHSTICFVPVIEDKELNHEDIFWLGYYVGLNDK